MVFLFQCNTHYYWQRNKGFTIKCLGIDVTMNVYELPHGLLLLGVLIKIFQDITDRLL